MKYVIAGLGGLIAAVVAAMLIVPAVIDWNKYRAEISAQASQALGRAVEIRGDIGLALLPAPVVTIEDAHLANIEGAAAADMVSLASLQVKMAWAPLLAGTVRVDSVKLVRPVFSIEVLDGGRSNLVFEPQAQARPPAGRPPSLPLTGSASSPNGDDGFDVRVDNFVVERGSVVFRHTPKGIVERIDDLNGRFAVASLDGPMEAVASAVVRGIPLSLELSTGEVIQGRTIPFNLDVAVAPGNAKVQFSGSLNGLDDMLRLKGTATVDGESFADFAHALGARGLPDALRRPFGAQANMALASDGVELADLMLRLDGTQAHGHLTADLSEEPTIEGNLAVSRVDLDSLLHAPAAKPEVPTKAAPKGPSPGVQLDLPSGPAPRVAAEGNGFSLETLSPDLNAQITLTVDAITWRNEAIRQARLNLNLANREIMVSQLSGLLPGGSDIALFGFITEKGGVPQFDGAVDVAANDLRGLMEWLGVSTTGIAGDRLRRLSLNAKLSARPDGATVSELRARVDASQIDGAVTATFAPRPSVGANLAIDRVNLDAYIPIRGETPPASDASSPAKPAPAPRKDAEPLGVFQALGAFDANLRARIGTMTAGGLPFNDVRLDASLVDGVLDVKSATIGDLLGVGASLSGTVNGVATAEPAFKDVVFEAKGKSLVNLFRLAEIKSPVSAEALGAVAVSGRIDGPLRALDLASEVQAMGGRTSFTGQLNTRDLLPRLDGRMTLTHPDFARFVRAFGPDYRPRGARGPIDLQAQLKGTIFEFALSELTGSVAGVGVQGGGALRLPLLGGKPRATVQLATGDLDIDSFLPQKRTAALETRPAIRRASYRMPALAPDGGNIVRIAAANGGRWSTEPLDLSVLSALNGALAVKSDSLKLAGVTIANADLEAELRDGLLAVRHLTGKTFGGDLTLDGGLAAMEQGGREGARFEARYALGGADIAAAERALGGKSDAKGSATFDGRLAGNGASVAELVASLAGEGSIALKGLDAAGGRGSVLAALGGIAQSLERLGGLRGKLEPVLLNLSGPYRVVDGVVIFDELAFGSALGDGALAGKADLPKWHLAAKGEIRLAKEFVIGDAQAAKPVPFSLEGALDAPRLKIDIAALPGGGLQVPLDKLRTRKGATEVLKGLLPRAAPKRETPTVEPLPPPGASAAPTPPPDVAPPQPARPEPNAGEKAEDILKGILQGIGR